MVIRNLLLTGGINHDYEDTADAIANVLASSGIETAVYADIDKGFEALDKGSFDLVTMFTLRWRMLDDDKYIPFRDEWAYEIDEHDRKNLALHVQRGKGLLGLHTASICFDTWPGWGDLLGARWQWGSTFHPPPEAFSVDCVADHPSTTGLGSFTVVDEIYHNVATTPASYPLLATTSSEDGATQNLAWYNEANGGRVIYSALGHDRASVTAPGHATFLRQAAGWCAGVIK